MIDFVGEHQIMARLKMPWRYICALVERERLPIIWVDGQPTLSAGDLAAWEAAREPRQ